MEPRFDSRVCEFQEVVLTLRSDLRFTPHDSGSRPGYVIEDPLSARFFRIGLPEYTFLSLLDGKTTVGEALRLTASALPESGLSEQEAAAVCRWLVAQQLALAGRTAVPNPRGTAAANPDRRSTGPRWNPLWLRLSLGNPDQLLTHLTPWLAWFYTWPVVAVWGLVLLAAGYQVNADWDRFVACSHGVCAPGNWLWLGACWLLLKTFHELSHGVVCKRYGGAVREAGVVLVLLTPIAYVDVTSSWRFRSRWPRIFTAAAGMYAELWIAAGAALVWSHTPPGVLNQLCFTTTVLGSVTTVVLNANPLMRFDGYFILSDLLGVPNLAASGAQVLRSGARRYLLGLATAVPPWPFPLGIVVPLYGLAALVWRVLVTAGLIVVATTLFQGAGVLLAAAGVACWLGPPLAAFVRYVVRGLPGERPHWVRGAGLAAAGSATLSLLLVAVPWPLAQQAPAMVEYATLSPIRAESAGFVRTLQVTDGQQVDAGQVLAVLANEELACSLAGVEIQIQQSEIRSRQYEARQELAADQAERAARAALEKRQQQLQAQVAGLTLRAPHAGKVLARSLATRVGTYIAAGEELCAIGSDDQKTIRVSISQDDVPLYTARLGTLVWVRLPGFPAAAARLARVSPRASLEPPHQAFCAPLGGPLAVRSADPAAGSAAAGPYEFFTPRFTADAELDAMASAGLLDGQRALVMFHAREDKIGAHLYRALARWVGERLRPQG